MNWEQAIDMSPAVVEAAEDMLRRELVGYIDRTIKERASDRDAVPTFEGEDLLWCAREYCCDYGAAYELLMAVKQFRESVGNEQ